MDYFYPNAFYTLIIGISYLFYLLNKLLSDGDEPFNTDSIHLHELEENYTETEFYDKNSENKSMEIHKKNYIQVILLIQLKLLNLIVMQKK